MWTGGSSLAEAVGDRVGLALHLRAAIVADASDCCWDPFSQKTFCTGYSRPTESRSKTRDRRAQAHVAVARGWVREILALVAFSANREASGRRLQSATSIDARRLSGMRRSEGDK